LFGISRNFPVELLLVRDDDIPCLVDSGAADMGVVGENVFFEKQCAGEAVLKLGFGFCSLALAVPEASGLNTARDLSGKKVATSYPRLTADFFAAMDVKGVKIVPISGSVEIAPLIGYADGIVDLVSTGSSLKQNKLKFVQKILDSQTVLISGALTGAKKAIADEIIARLNGVLSARKYKCVMMNAPAASAAKVREALYDKKALTVMLGDERNGCRPVQAVLDKDALRETVDALKELGASEIVVVDVETVIK
jgi:ATP phosphoribosyltransferase